MAYYFPFEFNSIFHFDSCSFALLLYFTFSSPSNLPFHFIIFSGSLQFAIFVIPPAGDADEMQGRLDIY